MTLFVEIAFRRRIPQGRKGLFPYRVPEKFQSDIARGQVVLAPFQGVFERGLVTEIHTKDPNFEVRDIQEICTPVLLLSWQFHFAQKVADHLLCPLGKILPLCIPAHIFQGSGHPPEQDMISLVSDAQMPEKMGACVKRVFDFLQKEKKCERLLLQKKTSCPRKTLEKMQEDGIVSWDSESLFSHVSEFSSALPPLTSEQNESLSLLKKEKKVLLMGATGSGKSHLLREYALQETKKKKTVLLLLPEVAITTDVLCALQKCYAQEEIVLYHSRLSAGERAAAFWKIKKGVARIIIGSSLALFLPFQNLSCVFLEEEHEWSYKQQKSPRYHARDVAEILADIHDASLVFSSASPSLESYMRTLPDFLEKKSAHNKISPLALTTLPARFPSPKLSFVDMREEQLAGNFSPFSSELLAKTAQVLQQKKQVLFFLNRRGFYRMVHCADCANTISCPDCQVSLTHHKKEGKDFLLCHSCGKVCRMPTLCPSCRGSTLRFWGQGTAGIEPLLATRFPQARLLRIDRDTTKKKTDFSVLYETFQKGECDILIGTQMIIKGIDFRHVGLVGVLDADAGLHIPDFRAQERSFQMLFQVMGRSGRRGQNSEVIIQTSLPDHPLFSFIKNRDKIGFYTEELSQRKDFFLPPFSRIFKLQFSHKDQKKAFFMARKAEEIFQEGIGRLFPEEQISLSVAPALVPKMAGRYRINLLLTAQNPEKILRSVSLPDRYILDTDPLDVLG